MAKSSGKSKVSQKKEKAKVRPAIQKKMDKVKEIVDCAKKYSTICLISAVKTPNNILQKLKRQLRGKAVFFMSRKVVMLKVLEQIDSPKVKELLQEPVYLVFTNLTPSEVYDAVLNNRESVFAVQNDIAPRDITVEKSDTELQPGPVLTELKTAGLDVMIYKGKISISKTKVIVKKGAKITKAVANVLRLLDVKPLEVSAKFLVGQYNSLIYSQDLLDEYVPSKLRDLVAIAGSIALNLSVNASYYTEQNISILIAKAYNESRAIAQCEGVYSDLGMDSLLAQATRQADGLAGSAKIEESQ